MRIVGWIFIRFDVGGSLLKFVNSSVLVKIVWQEQTTLLQDLLKHFCARFKHNFAKYAFGMKNFMSKRCEKKKDTFSLR